MSKGNLNTYGAKGANFDWQFAVVQLLGQINSSIGALPGVDYETRTTTYKATAAGPGYSIGDIIVRYDIINVVTSAVTATIWFNQTTQAVIAAPAPGNITPYLPPGNVTVTNPFNLEATQLLVLAALNSIDAGIPAALGQTTMANSMPVTIASNQSAVPVTLPVGVSRVPSVVLVPANTALSNTVAGKKQVSMRVAGANGQIGGVAIPNGITLTYTATSENDTVGSISYQTGVGTTILITYLT